MKLFGTVCLVFASVRLLPGAGPLVVGSCSGVSGFPTITAAVNAAPFGATINICPSDYPEQVSIGKSLNLVGLSNPNIANGVVVKPPASGVVVNAHSLYNGSSQAAQILVQNGAVVNITNITVDGSNNQIAGCGVDMVGILFQRASGSVSNSAVRNQALLASLNGCQSGESIFVESGYGTSGGANVSVTGCSIHGYQKNGVTADGSNTQVNIANNYISGQGPTSGAAENGIQVGDGANATISGNTVLDHIYVGSTYGAAGILIYASQGVTISNNVVGSSQLPIVTVTDPTSPSPFNPKGTADYSIITGNQVTNTQVSDGIDVCSNSNTISGNTIVNAASSGIHLDNTCGNTGKYNTVTLNVVNESCAGILQGATPNTILLNTVYTVRNNILAGDVCAAGPPALGTANSAGAVSAQLLPSRR